MAKVFGENIGFWIFSNRKQAGAKFRPLMTTIFDVMNHCSWMAGSTAVRGPDEALFLQARL